MNRRDLLEQALAAAGCAAAMPLMRRPLPSIRFGCAAITWNGNDSQAIADISALGYRGIQLRTSAVERWGKRPREFADLLAAHRLTLVALSSGLIRLDPAFELEDRELHLTNARFLKQAGGLYLQVIDQRPKNRAPVPDDFSRMGRLLTELGKRTSDLGVPLGYHHHMGSLGQSPEQIDQVLGAADPRYVKLELDTAHYQQGGGNPAKAITDHRERLLFLHLKDLEGPLSSDDPESYRFVELGKGRVDFPAIFTALEAARFQGWAIVELDEVTAPNLSPKESAQMSKRYLERLGFAL